MLQYVRDKIIVNKMQHDNNKLNLLLDLDNTIIYTDTCKAIMSTFEEEEEDISVIYDYIYNDKHYSVHGRQWLIDTLLDFKQYFNIYIYTNGTSSYAQYICSEIEKIADDKIFVGIISRNSINSGLVKYINILRHLTQFNTIIIDDRIDVWNVASQNNIIQIREYIFTTNENHTNDDELMTLNKILMSYVKNINKVNIHEIIRKINDEYQYY